MSTCPAVRPTAAHPAARPVDVGPVAAAGLPGAVQESGMRFPGRRSDRATRCRKRGWAGPTAA